MAELTTLARPYAKAVFQSAAAGGADNWSEQLNLLGAVAQQATMVKVFASPTLTSQQQAAAVVDVCGDALSKPAQNLVQILADNKRLPLLPEIATLFAQYQAEQERKVDVEVTTAYQLSDELQARLAAALKQKLDREVSMRTSVDSDLVGGVVIRAGDTVIDGSIRGRLAKLAEVMSA